MAEASSKIIAIVGPTASGKTALAIDAALRFDGEIVSADSRQIYRGMDIGTAKPSKEEEARVAHHMIDLKNPDEEYTVAQYKEDAIAAIRSILARGKLPIMTGGTGLYINAVVHNLEIPKAASDPELRAKLEKEIQERGVEHVFQKLIDLDPEAAYVVDPKNPRRIVRALEVAITTGEPFTAQRSKGEPLFNTLMLGLNPPPEMLRARIDRRIDAMMKKGLVREVERLFQTYGEQTSFDAIGYREIIEFLKGNIPLAEAIAEIKVNTWHYAKRQMTWFRKNKAVLWIENASEAYAALESFLR